MRRLVTSLSAQTRIQVVAEFLSNLSGSEVVFIAPTRTAADDVVRSLSLKSNGSFGVHRYTLASLAVEIASPHLVSQGFSILSGVAADALAARAVQHCRKTAELDWFEPVATTPGFFRALASTIKELRLNDVDATVLARSGRPGADLSRLLLRFEEELRESKISDLAMIYRIAAETVNRKLPLAMLDLPLNSSLERRFVQSLARESPSTLAVTHTRNVESVRALKNALVVTAENIENDGTTALSRLQSHVFSVAPPPAGEMDSTIEFRSATDESREAVEIARAVMAAAHSGVPFDRMAVLLRSAEPYQSLLEDAMRRAGIPAFFTSGSRRPNSAGRAFLVLLACAAEKLSASRFSEYLSLSEVPDAEATIPPRWVPVQGELFPEVTDELPASPATADAVIVRVPQAWERLIVDAAVIGGLERWERRLTGLDRELEKQIEEIKSEDEIRSQRLQKQRERLQDLRRFAIPLIARLSALPPAATWGEWLDILQDLAANSLRHPEIVLSVLAELRPMTDISGITLDVVREVLSHRLTFLRTDPVERRYGKVFVSTIAEAAGMSFTKVFLPGLGEDIFPRRAFEDPLLLDEFRKQISSDLAVQDTRFSQERLLLHIAAGVAEDALMISYPRMNLAQARSRGPSFYALELVRAVTGRIPDVQELQQRAAEASMSQAGWPSPLDASVAIDDAEYDLAIVSRLLRMPPQEAKGRGRYLVSANTCLARSLRNRSGRWKRRWMEGDGITDADAAVLAVLEPHRPMSRPYSATALQHFAACPYRFLLYAIQRLEPREEIAVLERMDALTRGSLFHAIQFRLLSELRRRGLLPITIANQQHVLEIGDVIVAAVSDEYREELAPAIPRIWDGEVENIRWDVRGWLRSMIQPENGWTPRWFELSFGLTYDRERDPASRDETIDLSSGLRLRGSIDMVEEHEGRLRVTDHKTGRAPFVPPGYIGRGEVLQPILYAQAAEALLGKPVEISRLFYCTERGGYRSIEVPINDESRAALDKVIQTIDSSITTGFLPVAPREGACKWCDYQSVCGPYEEMRVRRKSKDRLSGLDEIRKS